MKQILIAEDDAVTRKIITISVSQLGFVPIQASNGRIAWEILKDNPEIALLITDMMMPEMRGEDLVMAVRKDALRGKMPIIMISAVVKLSEIEHILRLGASRFIAKPHSVQDLKSYITQLVGSEPENNEIRP